MKYTPTIGIECHVQLATKTKLFSSVDNDARDKPPNSCVGPAEYALPGPLPTLNAAAVSLAVRAGLAMNCKINLSSSFDRKHYFYPDLPHGYQLTQFYSPIIGAGHIDLPDGSTVRIEHAHLEEDAGKLTHISDYSLIDLNRAGTALIEIVSQPDIHSALQARLYCEELWRLMTYTGASRGDLYHGNMRFDINISLSATKKLGTRVEIKNLNSFRSIERAVLYEISRQTDLLNKNETFIQETRGWSDAKGKTTSQRSKEQAQDYRYLPDPDLPPLTITQKFVAAERAALPLLPADYRQKLSKIIPRTTLEILLDYPPLIERLGQVLETTGCLLAEGASIKRALPKQGGSLSKTSSVITQKICSLFTSVLLAEENASLPGGPLPSADHLAALAAMSENSELSSTATKTIFLAMFRQPDKPPRALAEEMRLLQQNDDQALAAIIDQVLQNPAAKKAAADVRAGEPKALGFLIGQVMQASKGQANPSAVQKLLRAKLS